jgi:DNA polymerase III delta subunit
MSGPLHLAYYLGDDGYGLERAADAIVAGLAAAGPVDRWRVAGDATSAARIGERVGTASLFGGGTVAIVVEPGPLLRSKDDRAALFDVLERIAPGNGLVFLESSDGSRRAKALEDLAAAVVAAGGDLRELKAPREGQLAGWIEARARERAIALGPGAAKELATRVGGFVREGDVDRRRQGQLAVNELDKLGLYRPGAAVSVDDVRALVAEAIPGSAWAFLDAVAARRVGRALELLERLQADTHELVILAQLHRRIRELLVVADHLATGTRPGDLVRILKLKPYRAEKLVEQARTWTPDELARALEGLLEVDAIVRGADGAHDEAQQHLALTLWVAERVGRPAEASAGR